MALLTSWVPVLSPHARCCKGSVKESFSLFFNYAVPVPFPVVTLQSCHTQSSFPPCKKWIKYYFTKTGFTCSDFRKSSPEVWPDHEYRGGGGGTPGGGHVGPGPAWGLWHSWNYIWVSWVKNGIREAIIRQIKIFVKSLHIDNWVWIKEHRFPFPGKVLFLDPLKSLARPRPVYNICIWINPTAQRESIQL